MDVKFATLLLLALLSSCCPSEGLISSCEQIICPHLLDPVCGLFDSEFIFFPNHCEFELHSCDTGKEGKIIRHGKCPDWHVFFK